jgi:hypothetical protein
MVFLARIVSLAMPKLGSHLSEWVTSGLFKTFEDSATYAVLALQICSPVLEKCQAAKKKVETTTSQIFDITFNFINNISCLHVFYVI